MVPDPAPPAVAPPTASRMDPNLLAIPEMPELSDAFKKARPACPAASPQSGPPPATARRPTGGATGSTFQTLGCLLGGLPGYLVGKAIDENRR